MTQSTWDFAGEVEESDEDFAILKVYRDGVEVNISAESPIGIILCVGMPNFGRVQRVDIWEGPDPITYEVRRVELA